MGTAATMVELDLSALPVIDTLEAFTYAPIGSIIVGELSDGRIARLKIGATTWKTVDALTTSRDAASPVETSSLRGHHSYKFIQWGTPGTQPVDFNDIVRAPIGATYESVNRSLDDNTLPRYTYKRMPNPATSIRHWRRSDGNSYSDSSFTGLANYRWSKWGICDEHIELPPFIPELAASVTAENYQYLAPLTQMIRPNGEMHTVSEGDSMPDGENWTVTYLPPPPPPPIEVGARCASGRQIELAPPGAAIKHRNDAPWIRHSDGRWRRTGNESGYPTSEFMRSYADYVWVADGVVRFEPGAVLHHEGVNYIIVKVDGNELDTITMSGTEFVGRAIVGKNLREWTSGILDPMAQAMAKAAASLMEEKPERRMEDVPVTVIAVGETLVTERNYGYITGSNVKLMPIKTAIPWWYEMVKTFAASEEGECACMKVKREDVVSMLVNAGTPSADLVSYGLSCKNCAPRPESEAGKTEMAEAF